MLVQGNSVKNLFPQKTKFPPGSLVLFLSLFLACEIATVSSSAVTVTSGRNLQARNQPDKHRRSSLADANFRTGNISQHQSRCGLLFDFCFLPSVGGPGCCPGYSCEPYEEVLLCVPDPCDCANEGQTCKYDDSENDSAFENNDNQCCDRDNGDIMACQSNGKCGYVCTPYGYDCGFLTTCCGYHEDQDGYCSENDEVCKTCTVNGGYCTPGEDICCDEDYYCEKNEEKCVFDDDKKQINQELKKNSTRKPYRGPRGKPLKGKVTQLVH